MKSVVLSVMTVLLLAGCTNKEISKNKPDPTIRIVFDKAANGEINSTIISTDGNSQVLTFGTFISCCTEAMLGKKLSECKVKKGKTIYIYKENSKIYFDAGQGQQPFNIDVLLNALPSSLKDCDDMSMTQNENAHQGVQIYFKKDSGETLQAYIVRKNGKVELLNLGNLLCASAELMKDCTIVTDSNHFLNIIFGKTANGEMSSVLVDAAGNRNTVSLNNLVMAGVNTLVSCKGSKIPPMVPPTNIAPGTSIQIYFSNNSEGLLDSFIVNTKGERRELNLGTLLDSSINTKPCVLNTPEKYLDITFIKTGSNFKFTITDPAGVTKHLDLLNGLVNFTAEFCGFYDE
jgi:hypothetical protein